MGGRSYAYDRATAIIPTIVGPVSFFSSAYLLYRIYKNLKKTSGGPHGRGRRNSSISRTRDQLLIGLSFLDMFGSFGLSFSVYVASFGKGGIPSIGTIETCEAQGFLVQLGLGTPLYNAALCIYFVLTVRYNMQDETLSKWMVPICHVIILGYIFATAIYGLVTDVFNPAGVMGCWASEIKPEKCQKTPETCGRGQHAEQFAWIFAGIHLIICFVIVVISMIILYCTVRGIEARARRWDLTGSLPATQNDPTNRCSGTVTTVTAMDMSASNQHQDESRTSHTSGSRLSMESLKQSIVRYHQRLRESNKASRLTNTTRDTGFYYAASFILVYLPTFVMTARAFPKRSVGYRTFLILNAIFLPLQGFFNLLIYTSGEWKPWLRKKWDAFIGNLASEKNTNDTDLVNEGRRRRGSGGTAAATKVQASATTNGTDDDASASSKLQKGGVAVVPSPPPMLGLGEEKDEISSFADDEESGLPLEQLTGMQDVRNSPAGGGLIHVNKSAQYPLEEDDDDDEEATRGRDEFLRAPEEDDEAKTQMATANRPILSKPSQSYNSLSAGRSSKSRVHAQSTWRSSKF